jgi:hypothetical protein
MTQQLKTFLIQNIPADVSHFELYSGTDPNNLTLAVTNVIPDKFGYVKINFQEYRRATAVYYSWKIVDVFGNKSDFSDANILTLDNSQIFDKFLIQQINPDVELSVTESSDPIVNLGVAPKEGFYRYRSALKKANNKPTNFSKEEVLFSNQDNGATFHAVFIEIQPEKVYPGEKIRIFWRVEAGINASITDPSSQTTQLFSVSSPISLTGVIEDTAPASIGTYTFTLNSDDQSSTLNKSASYEVIASVGSATPSNEWLFDDSSGSIASDSNGSLPLSLSGSYTWGNGFLDIDGNNNNGNWITNSTGYFSTIDTFSVAVWVEPVAFTQQPGGGNIGIVTALGNGNDDLNNWAWYLEYDNTGAIAASISSGIFGDTGDATGLNITDPNSFMAIGTKQLLILTYKTNNPSASTNEFTISTTKDGVNWYSASTNTARYLTINSGYELRNNIASYHNTFNRYYKLDYFANKVLTQNEMQQLWNQGSESSSSVGSIQFTISDTEVFEGDSVTLNWNDPSASALYIDNGVGTVAVPSGSISVTPVESTIYTLICHDSNGAVTERSVSVNVKRKPVINFFGSGDISVVKGQQIHLGWSVSYANSISISGIGSVFSSDNDTLNIINSTDITPLATTSFILTASDKSGQNTTANYTITVVDPPEIQSFSMSPNSSLQNAGDSISLDYQAQNAADFSITGPDGISFTTNSVFVGSLPVQLLAANPPVFERKVSFKATATKDALNDSKELVLSIKTPLPILYTGTYENPDSTLTDIITDYTNVNAVQFSFNTIWSTIISAEYTTVDPLNPVSPFIDSPILTFNRDGTVHNHTTTIDFSEFMDQSTYDTDQPISFILSINGPAGTLSKTIVFKKSGIVSIS